MGSLELLVLFMQGVSIVIVAAGAYLCLVHVGLLPSTRAMGGFAVAASCVLFGAALGAVALSLSMGAAPVEAAEYAEPGWDAPRVMPVSIAMPFVPPAIIAKEPAAAPPRGDGSFEVYEYH
jgi:hypothetical protein